MKSKKISELQAYLTILFVTCYVVSNIIVGKTVSLPFGLTTTGAIFTIPMTYVLSDVFSECYGYRWSRVTCYIAFAMSFMEAMVAQLVIMSPFPAYYEGQAALAAVLGNTPRILIASMAAYVLGDLANDKVFAKFKAKHEGMEGFKARAFLSSVAGEFIDCLVFYPFALGGIVPSDQLVMVAATQIVAKLAYEALILPLTDYVAKRVNAYEAN